MLHIISIGAELEQAINEAEDIVAYMERQDFGSQNDAVELELELTKEILENVKNLFNLVEVREDLTKLMSDTVILCSTFWILCKLPILSLLIIKSVYLWRITFPSSP